MSTPSGSITVVLAAGTPDRAAELKDSLERADDRLAVEPVAGADAAAEIIEDSPVDCLVTVGDPAEPTGLSLVSTARDRHPELPILVCPDQTLDAPAVSAAFDAGATDVARACPDSDRTPVLVHRVSNAVASARAVAEAERQRDRFEEFVQGVSHDLRSPLNVAQGRLAMAQAEGGGEHVDDAASAVDRTLELLSDLLTLAEQGERPEDLDPVELAALADECWANVATGDATLTVDTDRRILADSGRLKRLLENLFRNSVEHAGDDVVVVIGDISPMYTTTRAGAVLPAGFFVADDGPGISPEARGRVFEVGYTTGANGTGFGLNIVSEVARAHGWEVTVSEGARGGARFDVTGVEFDD
ncbi:ATP-binding protein [Halorubrum ezzemoulense]|uniref:receiver/sensor box histidine kinase n=1 Tax=Halorubrum ezzemoulense TaxID=337243 RepID=UPI00232EE537|nr:ATP-binding protein [Halorubrum ezzemoulense]MDB2224969.1 ATP-binding protein [Halorubrum ezzemoulense]MDB2273972.1 ATP-binding protein [Halorubrum ezzemoulense]